MSLLDTASLVVTPNGTKASKLYSVVPSSGAGDLSVTRATTATRVNSSGLIESVASNVPRLDYTNGSCPSILVEPQRTNVCLQSNNVNNAIWGKDVLNGTQVITPNYGVSPDGTTNATRLQMSFTTGGYSNILQVIDTTPLIAYTYTVYIKSLSGTPTICFLNDGVTGNKLITLTNQWVRYTFNISTSGLQTYPRFLLSDGLTSSSADILVYGAQLEAGSYATSYIPTTSASVTRNADVISKTGISSLIGQTEGTLFYDGYFGNNNSEVYLFLQKSGSTIVDDSMYIQKESGNEIRFNSFLSSTSQVAISGGSFSIGDRIKIAVSYKLNDFVMYINGVQIGTDTSGTPPTCANLHLSTYAGLPTNEDFIANKGVNLTAFWKTRLTNTQLQTLTTI
jgi:hypothetical protein